MSFVLNGTISAASAIAAIYTDHSKWVEMAMKFHFLCYLAEFTLLTTFILVSSKQTLKSNQTTVSYNYRQDRFLGFALLFTICWIFFTDGNAIFSPRYAYQNLRGGIGPIWAGMIVFTTMYFVTKTVSSGRVNSYSYVFLVFIGFISGSKMVLVTAILFPIFLPQVQAKTRIILLPFVAIVSMFGFVSLFGGVSFFTNTGARMLSYFSMFNLSSRVFEDISTGHMDLHYGSITRSSIWAYVPRSLVPTKPYGFGSTYFVEYYFPGMAESGATPSFGRYTMYFADFWWFGVLISILRLPVFLRLWAIHQLIRVTKHSWRVPFASGFLLFPTMTFHIPILLSFIAYWMISRFSIGSK